MTPNDLPTYQWLAPGKPLAPRSRKTGWIVPMLVVVVAAVILIGVLL